MGSLLNTTALPTITFLSMAILSCTQESAPEVDASDLAITEVTVLPMTGAGPLPNHTVLVQDGQIVRVGPSQEVQVPENALVINGEGGYLMPGLVDTHVHIRAESELLGYLRYGITSIVILRGSPEEVALRERIRLGKVIGPRVFTSGPLVDGDPPIRPGNKTRILTDPADAGNVIREHLDVGYDLVKVYNNLDDASLRALVNEAREVGLSVVGHVPRPVDRRGALLRALDSGIGMISHGEEYFFSHFNGGADTIPGRDGFIEPGVDEIRRVAHLTRERGLLVTPNLSFVAMTRAVLDDVDEVFSNPEWNFLHPDVQELWRTQHFGLRSDLEVFDRREKIKYPFIQTLTASLSAEGVPLLVGTDASWPGLYPGESAIVELEELVKAGLSPVDALRAGTSNAGSFLRESVPDAPTVGTVAVGSSADLVLLRENPLENVGSIRQLRGVVTAGRWFAVEELNELRDAFARTDSEEGPTPGG